MNSPESTLIRANGGLFEVDPTRVILRNLLRLMNLERLLRIRSGRTAGEVQILEWKIIMSYRNHSTSITCKYCGFECESHDD